MNRVLLGSGTAEITEKKSRFIASAFEIHTENEAIEILEHTRKVYWDARHNCYAYTLGKNSELKRFSDDKEPQGTAGKPILSVLEGAQLRNTLIVVTRYFGGVLLGTGGLVRAYTAASALAVKTLEDAGQIPSVSDGVRLKITCEYRHTGRIESLLAKDGIGMLGKTYGENAVYDIAVSGTAAGAFSKAVTDSTGGACVPEVTEEITFCIKGGEALIYKF